MKYKNVIKRDYECNIYLWNGIKHLMVSLEKILETTNYISDESDIEKLNVIQDKIVVLHTKIGRIYELDIQELFVASMLCDSVEEIEEYTVYRASTVVSIPDLDEE